MLSGDVTSVTFKGVHYEIIVDIKGFKWMIQTTEKAEVGDRIGISIKPDEIQIMKRANIRVFTAITARSAKNLTSFPTPMQSLRMKTKSPRLESKP